MLVKMAKYVIVMDGNLSNNEVNVIRNLRKKKDRATFVINNYTRIKDKFINYSPNVDKWQLDLFKDLKDGKKCVIASSGGIEKLQAIHEQFKKDFPEKKLKGVSVNRNRHVSAVSRTLTGEV